MTAHDAGLCSRGVRAIHERTILSKDAELAAFIESTFSIALTSLSEMTPLFISRRASTSAAAMSAASRSWGERCDWSSVEREIGEPRGEVGVPVECLRIARPPPRRRAPAAISVDGRGGFGGVGPSPPARRCGSSWLALRLAAGAAPRGAALAAAAAAAAAAEGGGGKGCGPLKSRRMSIKLWRRLLALFLLIPGPHLLLHAACASLLVE